MTNIELDTSRFPLVLSRFPARFTAEEVDDYLARFLEVHERGEEFIHISDISSAGDMSSSWMRRKAAEFMKRERARSERLCKGAVHIAPGRVVRGAITAVHWMSPPPYPHAVVKDFDEAEVWARARAHEAGLKLPE